jgi:hypothetical protein
MTSVYPIRPCAEIDVTLEKSLSRIHEKGKVDKFDLLL